MTAAAARDQADHTRMRVGGLAKYLQRPPTAHGVALGALKEETAMINLVFSPPVWESYHRTVLQAPAVLLDGHLERSYEAVNLLVHHAQIFTGPIGPSHRRRGR
ncbi:hypothetical protein AB0L74_30805 [Streptomyces sp. NPDC052020]|uniref:hypothetical protein n=1 Tax=Streptomyces sp. NPDC052020 TaxID=3155677 RepID=UPI0034342574